MQWNKKFKLVEKALGFKLKPWQKDYISMKSDILHTDIRQSGNTTAFIMRHLLNNEQQLCLPNNNVPEYLSFPCDHDCNKDIEYNQYYYNFYRKEVMILFKKLFNDHIETSLDEYYIKNVTVLYNKLMEPDKNECDNKEIIIKNKQWLLEGDCEKCVKQVCCTKNCDKHKEYFRYELFKDTIKSIITKKNIRL